VVDVGRIDRDVVAEHEATLSFTDNSVNKRQPASPQA
jgi:hypothetical protein